MLDKDSLQGENHENTAKKENPQYYNSPSKDALATPIKSLFRRTNYDVGAFIEKFEELNRIKTRIKDVDLKRSTEEGKENKGCGNGIQ